MKLNNRYLFNIVYFYAINQQGLMCQLIISRFVVNFRILAYYELNLIHFWQTRSKYEKSTTNAGY